MRIKELADTAGTTVRTVRYYHQEGLLPVPPGTPRNYSFAHLVRLTRIRHLTSSGLSLEQIQALLHKEPNDVTHELEATKQAIDAHIEELLRQRARLEELQAQDSPTEIPLPQKVSNFYDMLIKHDTTGDLHKTIRREKHVVEVLCHLGILRDYVDLWPIDPTTEYLDLALRMYRSFENIKRLTPEEAAEEIDDLISEHLHIAPMRAEAIAEITQKFAQTPGAIRLLTMAYPHPNQRLYIAAFLTRFTKDS